MLTATTLIEIPAWGHITLIEAIWLFSGLLAVAVTVCHIGPLYDDYVAARITGRPVLAKVAWAYVRREIIRLAQGLCLTSIGIYAALEPPAIPGPAVVSIVGIVLTGVLLAISFLVSLQSQLDWRTRTDVQRLLDLGANGKSTKEDPIPNLKEVVSDAHDR